MIAFLVFVSTAISISENIVWGNPTFILIVYCPWNWPRKDFRFHLAYSSPLVLRCGPTIRPHLLLQFSYKSGPMASSDSNQWQHLRCITKCMLLHSLLTFLPLVYCVITKLDKVQKTRAALVILKQNNVHEGSNSVWEEFLNCLW